MQSKAATVQQYLAELPPDRRAALEQVRSVILKNLDKRGFAEGMQYGMIGYFVPHAVFPAGYHCDPKQPLPFAALASQKNHMALYMMATYASEDQRGWFTEAWARTGKKLDMGKSCVRFKKVEDLALEVIGEAIRRVSAKQYVADYEAGRVLGGGTAASKKVAAKATSKTTGKAASKKVAAKTATKKVARKVGAAKKTAAKKTAKRA